MWPKIFEFFRETFRSLETLAVVKGTVVVFTNNPPKGHAWFTTVQAFNQQNPQTTFIEKQHKKTILRSPWSDKFVKGYGCESDISFY